MSDFKIQVKGDFYFDEFKAGGTIKPGHLVSLDSNGDVVVNSEAGLACLKAFAVESSLEGGVIEGTASADTYSDGEVVRVHFQYPGAKVQARIANGESIAIGDKLVSNGNGELKEMTADSSATIAEEVLIAIAEEACDMSDSSAADPDGLCKVRIV